MSDYKYDVFLSFTGADREWKDAIKERLAEMGLTYYDSDSYCKGQFREDFCEALDQSRVYLLLLTDNLRNDPLITQQGRLTEVRRECGLACDLESANQLNIVILCMSEFFRYTEPFHNYNDKVGWFFYSSTRGFSQVFGQVDDTGALSEQTLSDITSRCSSFVEKRNAGQPVLSQMPKLEIASEQRVSDLHVQGRETEIQAVLDAFAEGKQVVVLRGIGGMGKTTLAMEIARRCDEMGYLKCPQIVHVQELIGERGGLRTLVSSTSYDKVVYDSIGSLPERDKYERKVQALSSLPETVLLIVDNYNLLNMDDIRDMLSRLKCRLLITTRAHIESDGSRVAVVPVEQLKEDLARRMFEDVYGTQVETSVFRSLYTAVGGHTITLCIVAKMMKLHHLDIHGIMKQMGDLGAFDAKVAFSHNEYGDSNTVLGHLQNLFSISQFSDGCLRILRSMSLLSDGTIAVADLMQILQLSNRNDILELINSGWVELQTVTVDGQENECLYLHPILSRLMAQLLVPTEENASEMVRYLADSVDRAMAELTYADATALGDRLFYACYVLAGSNHRLAQELWTRFVAVDRLLGDASATNRKVDELMPRLQRGEEQTLVRAYGDMILLEQHPTRVDVLGKYVAALDAHSDDYKWVMRCLSVTVVHIYGVPEYAERLEMVLEKALAVSMEAKDDFAILSLMPYFTLTAKSAAALYKQLSAYVKQRHSEGATGGAITMLDMYALSLKLMDMRKMSDLATAMQTMMNNLLDKNTSDLGFALRHPLAFMRAQRLSAIIERGIESGSDDPLIQMMCTLVGEMYKVADGDKLEAANIIQMMVNLHYLRVNHNMTLSSAAEAVMGALQVLKIFPDHLVHRGVMQISDQVDMDNISVQALSNLQVAALINREYGNRQAMEQAKDLIYLARRLRPEGHHDILSAIDAYGDICAAFGEKQAAMAAYIEVFNHWYVNAPDSVQLTEIAKKILGLDVLENFSLSIILSVIQSAIIPYSVTERYRYEALFLFATCVLNKYKYRSQHPDLQSAITFVWERVDEGLAQLSAMTLTGQQALLSLLDRISSMAVNLNRNDIVEEAQQRMRRMEKSPKKSIKHSAKAYHLFSEAYAVYRRKEEGADQRIDKAIRYCIKHRTNRFEANIFLRLLLGQWLPDSKDMPADAATFFGKFVSNPVLIKPLEQLAEMFCTQCIVLPDWVMAEENAGLHRKVGLVYLSQHLRDAASQHASDLCIPIKTFKRLRTVEQYYMAALSCLMQAEIAEHRNAPIRINITKSK